MTQYTFDYLNRTGLTQAEVLRRAEEHKRAFEKEFPGNTLELQDVIDSVIDAAIEYAQG